MKFAIFGLCASVDIRPLPGAWVAELLGVVLGSRTTKISNFHYSSMAAKRLKPYYENFDMTTSPLSFVLTFGYNICTFLP